MQTKILTDHMPDEPEDCPFSIKESQEQMPPVCMLKLQEYQYRHGITFGHGRNMNCKTDTCPYLKADTNQKK